jgi:hypothetical protein
MNPEPMPRPVPRTQVIPLEQLRANFDGKSVACTEVNGDEVGTLGTQIFHTFLHTENRHIGPQGKYVCTVHKKVWEKRVPIVPDSPDLEPVVHALDYGHPRFREPANGEVVVGLYRNEDGSAAPMLLWADPKVDLFWDMALRQHVRPPAWYLRLDRQPPIDPATGYPIIEGAVCPF